MKRALLWVLFLATQAALVGVLLEKTGTAYERGQISVVYACAQSQLFVVGSVIVVCELVDGNAPKSSRGPATQL